MPRLIPPLIPSAALLLASVMLCAACDDPDSSGPAGSASKKGHHARAKMEERATSEGPAPKGKFKIGRMDRKLIPESSGVIDSRKTPGVFWTFNDSGNGPDLFAITREGKLLERFTLNVHNTDWEAMTADDEGHLYVGDMGNNEHRRDRVFVYRVDEPEVDPTGKASTAPPTPLRVGATWRLEFPDQPFDTESLFLHDGKGYVISKLLTGKPAGLYSFDLGSTDESQTLRLVCDLPIRTPVTDAAISRDGARLAVMTVTGPYLFQIDGEVTAVSKVEPKHQLYFDLKDMNMEGVCFVEGGLLATTEQGQMLFFAEKDFK